MDNATTRRLNLQLLINLSYKGVSAQFAHAIKRSPGQIYKLVGKKHDSGSHNPIGTKLVKVIEDHFKLDAGWLDMPRTKEWMAHELIDPVLAAEFEQSLLPNDTITMGDRKFLYQFRVLDERQKSLVMKTMEILLDKNDLADQKKALESDDG